VPFCPQSSPTGDRTEACGGSIDVDQFAAVDRPTLRTPELAFVTLLPLADFIPPTDQACFLTVDAELLDD
jgi:hypothetical protein